MPETATPKPVHEVHHPATVGSTFMRQYYHFLAKEPASLHRFYKDESIWCHGVGSHMQEAISGQKAINDEILRRGYAGARVDLDIGSIDCQASLNGGVFVLVTGVMTLASSPVPKPFVQTFFLAVQPKGYFVLNDCLRFLELPGASPASLALSASDAAVAPKDAKKQPAQAAIGTPVAASPAAKAKPVTPVAAVKKEKVPTSPAKKVETPASPVKVKSPAKVASPKASPAPAPAPAPAPVAAPASPVKKVAAADEKSIPKPSETKPATPASPTAVPASPAHAKTAAPAKPAPADPVVPPAPVAPAAPKTWAALFSAAAAAAPAAPATSAPKSAPAAKPTPASPAPAAAAAPAKAAETPAAPQEKKEEKEKKRYFSLYIRDMPPQAKDTDLRELFKSYGAIANVTVPQGRGFAFVDFFEQESMRAALAEEKEFKLFDKVIHVDERTERKDKDRGFRSDRGGRGGRGPKGGRIGDRKEREDGKERREVNGKAPASTNGPRNNGDRREKGGRRSGKEEGGRGNKD